MPLDDKSFDLNVFGFPNLQTGEHPKSKLLASRGMLKTSNLKFLDQDLEFEAFNILGHAPGC